MNLEASLLDLRFLTLGMRLGVGSFFLITILGSSEGSRGSIIESFEVLLKCVKGRWCPRQGVFEPSSHGSRPPDECGNCFLEQPCRKF